MELMYFGKSDCPLLGAYHPSFRQSQAKQAVLICPSIGHEYIRSHWAVKRLAMQLARAGVPTLRFDYHGIGDSSSDMSDIGSIEVWQQDILSAAEELQSQAFCETIVVVALRMGAMLAASVSHKIPGLRQMVFWEPIFDGDIAINQWRTMHRQMVDLWARPIQSIRNEAFEEILGSLYSQSLLTDLVNTHIDSIRNMRIPLTIVGQTEMETPLQPVQQSRSHLLPVKDTSDWNDLRSIETAWLPTEGPKAIIDLFQQSMMVGV